MINLEGGPPQDGGILVDTNAWTGISSASKLAASIGDQIINNVLHPEVFNIGDFVFIHNADGTYQYAVVSAIGQSTLTIDSPLTINVVPGAALIRLSSTIVRNPVNAQISSITTGAAAIPTGSTIGPLPSGTLAVMVRNVGTGIVNSLNVVGANSGTVYWPPQNISPTVQIIANQYVIFLVDSQRDPVLTITGGVSAQTKLEFTAFFAPVTNWIFPGVMGQELKAQSFPVVVPSDLGSLRVSSRPADPLASYRLATISGSIAATLGAGSTIFSMRWGNATNFFKLERFAINIITNGTITTAVTPRLGLFVARGFTASDTGGTVPSLATNFQKARTSLANSLITDMRIATTAALGVGTRTVDALPIRAVRGFSGTTAPARWFLGDKIVLYDQFLSGEDQYPIILAMNEGILLQNIDAGPATGTFIVEIEMDWSELATYSTTANGLT